MTSWIEPEVRNRVWTWLSDEKNCTVWPEVPVNGGRIDLVAETNEEEYWGIEIKGCPGTDPNHLYQLKKYIQSDSLDRVYFASNNTEYIIELFEDEDGSAFPDWRMGKPIENLDISRTLEDKNTTSEPALKQIENYGGTTDIPLLDLREKVGVISVPIGVELNDRHRVTINQNLESLLKPESVNKPVIEKEAKATERDGEINTRRSEMSLHFELWKEFGGLVEACLPHPEKDSYGNKTINIDLLFFKDATTATEVLENGGRIVGVEAKTDSGLKDSNRLKEQMQKYTETKCLTDIFLAVPETSVVRAGDIVDDVSKPLGEKIGILSVANNESLEVIRQSEKLPVEHDAYGPKELPYSVGYGNSNLPKDSTPISIYKTKNRNKNHDPEETLRELYQLKQEGNISDEEFSRKRQELID